MKKLYKNLMAAFVLSLSFFSAKSQVSYTQDFSGGLSSWTGFTNSATNACGGVDLTPRYNIYSGTPTRIFTSPSLGTSNGGLITMNFDYKVVEYSDGTATPVTFGTITAEYASSSAGPWTTSSMVVNSGNHVASNVCATKSFTFTPPAGALFVRFNCVWNTGDYYIHFDNVNLSQGAAPACAAPTALTAANVNAVSADLSWSNASGSLWNVEYGAAPFTPTGTATAGFLGLTDGGNGTPVPITGLTANTSYSYYVQSDCGGGDESSWTGPFTFTTPCAIITPPYTQAFTTFLPDACWSVATSGTIATGPTGLGSSSWGTNSNLSSTTADINIYGSGVSDWVLTPHYDLSGGMYEVKLDVAVTNWNSAAADAMEADDQVVLVYTEDGTTWNVINTWTAADNLPNALTSFTFYNPSNAIDVQFGVYASSGTTTGTDYDFHIDNFIIQLMPACPDPSNLVTTWIDNDSVIFTWDAGYLESNWNVEVGAVGFTPGTGTATFTGTSIVAGDTAAGLTQVNDYEIYIQADCGAGDMSSWIGPVTVTTLPDCAAPTNFVAQIISPDSVDLSWTAAPGGATDWTISYGPAPFMPGDAGEMIANASTNSSDTIGGLMQNTTYSFYVLSNCTSVDSSLWVGPETVTTSLFCNNVSGLSASTVADTAFLSWNVGSNAETMWNVEYGPTGFALGSGVSYTTTENNSDTLLGLLGSATYQFYVQAACASGDTSLFTGPYTFSMPLTNDDACDAIDLPVDGLVRYFSNVGATAGATEEVDLAIPGSNCSSNDAWCNSEVTFSTWFTFTAPASGNVIVSTTDGTADGQLAIFDATDCADFSTYTMLAANDDFVGLAPEASACGLTPGNTYYVMYDSWSNSAADASFAMELIDAAVDAGIDGSAMVCSSDLIDLNSVASINDPLGVWTYDLNPSAIVDDSLFNASSVLVGTQVAVATYYVTKGCAIDSAVATLTVVAAGQSGTAIVPYTVCNTDVFLPNGLTGAYDNGGTWSDDSGTGLLGGANGNLFAASGLPVGSYPFTYTISNGVCPDASTTVDVILTNCTSVDENAMVFTVYPNPNEGIFNITSTISEMVTISVLDVQGKVVYNNKMSITGGVSQVISLENVETGMYILKIASESNVSTQSFIVK